MRDNITLICKNSRQQPQYRQHRILEMLEQKGWLDKHISSSQTYRNVCSVDRFLTYTPLKRIFFRFESVGPKFNEIVFRSLQIVSKCEYFFFHLIPFTPNPYAKIVLTKHTFFYNRFSLFHSSECFFSPTLFDLSHLTFIMYCSLSVGDFQNDTLLCARFLPFSNIIRTSLR